MAAVADSKRRKGAAHGQLPTDRLLGEAQRLAGAYAERAVSKVSDKVGQVSERLTDYAENGGPGLAAALKGGESLASGKPAVRGLLSSAAAAVKEKVASGGRGNSGPRLTNIVEYIDVGVPVDVAYNQWTQFQDFPKFMKNLESADQTEATKVNWKARVFWSHRSWESTIVDQQPDEHIVWRASGPKGHVDGAVTFHELAPDLTRVLVVLEYHPQGLFERTGNLWRAQGRRARLELKHFQRHVMTETLLHPADVDGWRGEIHDSEVTEPPDDEDYEESEYDDEYEDDEDDDDEPADEDQEPDEERRR